MPLFCPKCGTQNSDWAQTCLQCSAPIPYKPTGPAGGKPPYAQPTTAAPYGQPQVPAYGAPPYGSYQSQVPSYGMSPTIYYPGHGRRIAAYLLDGLLVGLGALPGGLIMGLSFILASAARGEPDAATAGLLIATMFMLYGGMILIFLWNTYLLGRDGASLGKRWMGIKVLDQSGQPLGFWKALIREIVKVALGNLCIILWLWPLWDNEKQGLYDKIFSTHLFKS